MWRAEGELHHNVTIHVRCPYLTVLRHFPVLANANLALLLAGNWTPAFVVHERVTVHTIGA